MKKTWKEKLYCDSKVKVVTLEKPFGGMLAGDNMLVATPLIVKRYVDNLKEGESLTIKELRDKMGKDYGCSSSCPLSTSIFLRIVAEYSLENMFSKKGEVSPFWRVISEEDKISKKLSCDLSLIKVLRNKERIA